MFIRETLKTVTELDKKCDNSLYIGARMTKPQGLSTAEKSLLMISLSDVRSK